MKIGSIEGTHEEVKDVFKDNGLNLSDYLEKPKQPLSKIWIIIPGILFVIFVATLLFAKSFTPDEKLFTFILGFLSSVWAAVSVHIRFKTIWGASAVVLAGLLIMLIAYGVMTPSELLEHYQNNRKDA